MNLWTNNLSLQGNGKIEDYIFLNILAARAVDREFAYIGIYKKSVNNIGKKTKKLICEAREYSHWIRLEK